MKTFRRTKDPLLATRPKLVGFYKEEILTLLTSMLAVFKIRILISSPYVTRLTTVLLPIIYGFVTLLTGRAVLYIHSLNLSH